MEGPSGQNNMGIVPNTTEDDARNGLLITSQRSPNIYKKMGDIYNAQNITQ